MTIEKSPEIPQISHELMEKVLLRGDMKELDAKERLSYISMVCKSLGLNALTRPFEYIDFKGKLTLYARKDATDQLRKIYKISTKGLEKTLLDDIYQVTAYVCTADGRVDCATGAVYTKGLSGDNLSNAFMKAETKAKRRATLSICGLGMLDDSEVDSIPEEKIFYNTVKEVAIIDKIEAANTMEDLKLAYFDANTYYQETKDFNLKKKFTELVQNKKQQLQNINQINIKEHDSKIEKINLSI